MLRALLAGIRFRACVEPAANVHVDGANTTLDPDTLALHAFGAVAHAESESLLGTDYLLRLKRVVDARVAGFFANAGRPRVAGAHLRRALPGPLDARVVREVAYIPVQGLRGYARRRYRSRARALPATQPRLGTGPVVVLAPNPAEAWVRECLVAVARIAPDVRFARSVTSTIGRESRLASWRIARSGEQDALLRALVAPEISWQADDGSSVFSHASLVVDLSGSESYKPLTSADPPVMRVRFGRHGGLRPETMYRAAMRSSQTVGRLFVTLERSNGRSTLRSAPVVITPTSRALTCNGALWKAAASVPRAMATLTQHNVAGASAQGTMLILPDDRTGTRRRGAARLARSVGDQLLKRERWGVALLPPAPSLPSTDHLSASHARWIESDQTIADPCLFEFAGSTYLFVERADIGERGRIASARIHADGAIDPLIDVLVEDHHLSYPMVFTDDDETWLVPESSAARAVRLYRAQEFPLKWSYEATLLDDIVAFDPTFHRTEQGYWMFLCVAPFGRGRNDELWLFQAPSLFGPWRPHRANPVVDDPRRARPAGRLFHSEGRLLRPSQDCSVRYGRRIVLNEILELTNTRYVERPIAVIEPTWSRGLVATHTISRTASWQALDGACLLRSPLAPRRGAHP